MSPTVREPETVADELVHVLGVLARTQELTPDSPEIPGLSSHAEELKAHVIASLAKR